MKTVFSTLLLTAIVMLGGCQTLSGLESPDLSVSDIRLDNVTLFEQQWDLTLRARNPNDRELTLKSLDYQIYLNGEKFARGLTSDSVTLPAMGDALVTTHITTSLFSSLKQLQKLQQNSNQPLQYRLVGKARVAGVPLPLSFDKQGQVSLPATPGR
ncbi:MAG: LEA type 2 family protein [Alcanivorax sp.]|nr:LEA type 2 family protein [Alcanivorax sp.]